MKIIAIVTAAALALGLTTSAGLAQPVTAAVSFADLDVGTAAGKNALAQRIAIAAGTVCGVETGTTDLASHIAARTCRARAIAVTMLALTVKTSPQMVASR